MLSLRSARKKAQKEARTRAAYYDIQLICRDGRNRNAGGQIPNKREAVWLMNQMKQAMGR